MRAPAVVIFGVVLAIVLTPVAAIAGSLEDGLDAHDSGDYAAALRLWRPLAEQGHAQAQYNLGVVYRKGQGVLQDYAVALKWYRLAAEQGFPDAQSDLGFMYDIGQGVPQDYAEAVKWYRLAAEQGHAIAQFNLGIMYDNGQGVPQDHMLAHMWLNLAASRSPPGEDYDEAVQLRDAVAERMTPAQIAEAQKLARQWWKRRKQYE